MKTFPGIFTVLIDLMVVFYFYQQSSSPVPSLPASEPKPESELEFVIVRDEFDEEEEEKEPEVKSARSVKSIKSRKSIASSIGTQDTDATDSVSGGKYCYYYILIKFIDVFL